MYLVSAFRRLPFVSNSFVRAVPSLAVPVASALPVDQPAGSGEERRERPLLTCRWEVVEDPSVELGDGICRRGDLFLHWTLVP